MSETTVITNRQRLLADLAALSPKALNKVTWGINAGDILDFVVCDDCREAHGGQCPTDENDGPCPWETEDWLEMPCRHAHLITEAQVVTEP